MNDHYQRCTKCGVKKEAVHFLLFDNGERSAYCIPCRTVRARSIAKKAAPVVVQRVSTNPWENLRYG